MKTLKALQTRHDELRAAIAEGGRERSLANQALADATTDADRQKAHQRIDNATKAEERAERELVAILERIDQLQGETEDAAFEKRCEAANAKAALWLEHVKALHDKARELAAQFKLAEDSGAEYRKALPIELQSAELMSFAFTPTTLLTLANLELFIASDGKMNAGKFSLTPAVLAQGPGLVARAKENIARLADRMEQASKPTKDAA